MPKATQQGKVKLRNRGLITKVGMWLQRPPGHPGWPRECGLLRKDRTQEVEREGHQRSSPTPAAEAAGFRD